MDERRAQRIRDGLDTAYGAFFLTLGAAGAIALVAFVLIGMVAAFAWMAERM